MPDDEFALRRAGADDFDRWADLYEEVASEGRWIGGEAPVDRPTMRQGFIERFVSVPDRAAIFMAESSGQVIGHLGIEIHRGVADLGMMVAFPWRARGVGSALMAEAVQWAKQSGAHKVVLHVWPHNHPARALYRKFGFADEGQLRRHYRRRNGQLWDAITMALILDHSSPGSPFD